MFAPGRPPWKGMGEVSKTRCPASLWDRGRKGSRALFGSRVLVAPLWEIVFSKFITVQEVVFLVAPQVLKSFVEKWVWARCVDWKTGRKCWREALCTGQRRLACPSHRRASVARPSYWNGLAAAGRFHASEAHRWLSRLAGVPLLCFQEVP